MSPQKRPVESGALEVQFVGDDDVVDHIVEKHDGTESEQPTSLLLYVFPSFHIPKNFHFSTYFSVFT